eukprot:TRINITY_DN12067_c0_g1_i1.p1 TRINITY_DN12067_c0_g1~~TRINITY_DN12067_c0_g1_i1.p1  ORF type:complete len:117 (-),score=23.80 TRINITY_DN12067_c0_g1_i1:48-398(-)
MIQGGGYTKAIEKIEPDRTPIFNEWNNGLTHVKGSIAMARLTNSPNSATTQFFINLVDNTHLDKPQQDGAGYTVFGRVASGFEVLERIGSVDTVNHPISSHFPAKLLIVVKSISRV